MASYINIPSFNNNNINFDIKKYDENLIDNIYISNSLYVYLSNIKQQIDNFNTLWDQYKKITNPYEYIHTTIPNYKNSICKYKPLSRSFFKMIEIINSFNLLNDETNITSFHLAEGPGGFIEAFTYYRKKSNDTYYGMTLISDDINIPSWKKSMNFINNNSNIILENGITNNGNLFEKENLKFCYEKYNHSINYITADGGFDFSIDFNKQEDLSFKLILTQIFYAILMQKKNGTFILKIFDIFKYKTIEIIYLLSILYENTYIYKPNTSRIANSEKYIICKNFKLINLNLDYNIINNFDYILDNINNIYSLFNFDLPKLFINKIEEINAIYGQQQIENINTTLNIIRENRNLNNINNSIIDILNKLDKNYYFKINELEINNPDNILNNLDLDNNIKQNIIKFYNKINSYKNINILKSIEWCNKYNFEINYQQFK